MLLFTNDRNPNKRDSSQYNYLIECLKTCVSQKVDLSKEQSKNAARENTLFGNQSVESRLSAAGESASASAAGASGTSSDNDSVKYVLDLFPNLEREYVRV